MFGVLGCGSDDVCIEVGVSSRGGQSNPWYAQPFEHWQLMILDILLIIYYLFVQSHLLNPFTGILKLANKLELIIKIILIINIVYSAFLSHITMWSEYPTLERAEKWTRRALRCRLLGPLLGWHQRSYAMNRARRKLTFGDLIFSYLMKIILLVKYFIYIWISTWVFVGYLS